MARAPVLGRPAVLVSSRTARGPGAAASRPVRAGRWPGGRPAPASAACAWPAAASSSAVAAAGSAGGAAAGSSSACALARSDHRYTAAGDPLASAAATPARARSCPCTAAPVCRSRQPNWVRCRCSAAIPASSCREDSARRPPAAASSACVSRHSRRVSRRSIRPGGPYRAAIRAARPGWPAMICARAATRPPARPPAGRAG